MIYSYEKKVLSLLASSVPSLQYAVYAESDEMFRSIESKLILPALYYSRDGADWTTSREYVLSTDRSTNLYISPFIQHYTATFLVETQAEALSVASRVRRFLHKNSYARSVAYSEGNLDVAIFVTSVSVENDRPSFDYKGSIRKVVIKWWSQLFLDETPEDSKILYVKAFRLFLEPTTTADSGISSEPIVKQGPIDGVDVFIDWCRFSSTIPGYTVDANLEYSRFIAPFLGVELILTYSRHISYLPEPEVVFSTVSLSPLWIQYVALQSSEAVTSTVKYTRYSPIVQVNEVSTTHTISVFYHRYISSIPTHNVTIIAKYLRFSYVELIYLKSTSTLLLISDVQLSSTLNVESTVIQSKYSRFVFTSCINFIDASCSWSRHLPTIYPVAVHINVIYTRYYSVLIIPDLSITHFRFICVKNVSVTSLSMLSCRFINIVNKVNTELLTEYRRFINTSVIIQPLALLEHSRYALALNCYTVLCDLQHYRFKESSTIQTILLSGSWLRYLHKYSVDITVDLLYMRLLSSLVTEFVSVSFLVSRNICVNSTVE